MKGLFHKYCESQESFFKKIDNLGGWPVGNKFVTFIHSVESERECYFGNEYKRDGWNTTIYSADEYCWWKISDEGRKRIREEFFQKFKHLVDSLK
jgi:hypothetical protein